MRRFLYILESYREYLLLAFLSVISLALFPLNDNPQIKQLRAYTIAGIGMLNKPVSFFTETFTLRGENQRLRRANIQLSDEVYQLREARLENIRLRRMLQFSEHSRFELIPAKVVGRSADPVRNTATINVGTHHGISEYMPVVTDAGLVGRVILASERFSVVQLMINRDFRTSAKIERSRVDGILRWNGSDGMLLTNVAKTLDVIEGDIVLTSEYSNVFPPGLYVGVVSRVFNVPGSLTKEIQIVPGVDFTRLEEVFIILYRAEEDKITLENRPELR
jgi:rod shape-determining protein MreC